MGLKLIPKLISTETIMSLDARLVAKQICSEYTGTPIKKVGDTVYFPTVSDVNVYDYKSNDRTIKYDKLNDGLVGFKIDQEKQTGAEFDTIDEFQRKISSKNSYVKRAAYALAKEVDTFIFSKYTDAGIDANAEINDGDVFGLNDATIKAFFRDMATLAANKNMDTEDLFMVTPPFVLNTLKSFGIEIGINEGMDGRKGGVKMAEYFDFDIYTSTNLPKTGDTFHCMAGVKDAIRYVSQITETKVDDNPSNTFGSTMAQLHVYGGGVVSKDKLIKIDLEKIADA